MAVAIGGPAGDNRARHPDWTVVGHGAPSAIVIEIFITDYIRRNVAGGGGVILVIVAVTAPAIEVIVTTEAVKVGGELISSSERGVLIGMHGEGLTATRHFAFAAPDGDGRRVARFIDLKAVVTGSKKIEG